MWRPLVNLDIEHRHLRAALARRPPRRLGDLLDERSRHRASTTTTCRVARWRSWRASSWRSGSRSAAHRGGALRGRGRASTSTRRTSTGCTRPAAARRSRSTPTRRRCGGWGRTRSRLTAALRRTSISYAEELRPATSDAALVQRSCASELVPGGRRRHPRGAGPRPSPPARAPAGGRAGVVAARAGWLARHEPRARASGDAGRRDVHGRRPALLDRAGRRPEHAHARRRRARAPSRRRSRGRSGWTRCASGSRPPYSTRPSG